MAIDPTLAALIIALLGSSILMASFRLLRLDALGWSARSSLWIVAAAAVSLFAAEHGGVLAGLDQIGLGTLTEHSAIYGAIGAVAVMAAAAFPPLILRAFGIQAGERAMFESLTSLPFLRRLFLVSTAAVVEEVLYRGVGLTAGQEILGGAYAAAALSVAAFSLAHFRWRATHIPTVAASAIALTILYYVSGRDLWACIIAHFIFDALGFLLAPAIIALKRRAR